MERVLEAEFKRDVFDKLSGVYQQRDCMTHFKADQKPIGGVLVKPSENSR